MLASGLGIASPALAQIGGERYAAIVLDARSGNTLIAANPDERRYPASLTKMMTLYMAFEALKDDRIELSTPVPVSYSAASMAPSKLGLTPGMSLTVEEAILALVTKSANDAAAALGELLGGGSEDRFAQMMTLKARSLGMRNTTFRNASGLPDIDQVSTARDMALLGQRLIKDFPDRYTYFSTPHFVFRGRTHWNHNRLLQEYDGADGIKTGYVDDSGFNLVASAQREGVRLVAAVFGGRTGRERDRHMMSLLDQGFTSLGVATPETPMARRALPGLLASAQAATPHGGWRTAARATGRAVAARAAPAPKATAFRLQESRPALLRMATTRPARAAARPEQGDTSRVTAPAKRQAVTFTKPAEKPAAKPQKTAANTRRAG
ncbi:D-alanyl-D-alanine carboxypeptidase family protein [Paracraurococcus sp. LOR1-02]|uniref:D-alanyl-D-alanine carboxypeptidase family protein n=2 Tax=Paracraurococcus lichenis TaxID=3064888 RepID=A0ABT9DTK0_9PROT|nr:D-alanyl-D-alanine carboxypeptidase family protein [Paracraurococcus sp. LOR1-02]MDO9707203.1 D-alanyl-D-alanine carboxypeptidase family protein [Paracraurococcus sp. LOR1-02]